MTRATLVVTFLLLLVGVSARSEVDHSHARFDEVLERHVSGGLVDYRALKRADADTASAFSVYLRQLAGGPGETDSTWTRAERLAYWINAYNAFTLKLIVNDYPIDAAWYMWVFPFVRFFVPANSILMIGGRWDDKTFDSVRGAITLDTIEHEILRGEIGDARIHFAIVCASLGCPDLRSRAYHSTAIDDELEQATRDFMRDPEHVRVDADGHLDVSKIFEWFREDFDAPVPGGADVFAIDTDGYGEDAGVARWVAAYGSEEIRLRVAAGPFSLGHLGYDWSLNEQPRDDD